MSGQRNRARRRSEFSQHFLRGKSLAARLVTDTSISRDDFVIEIGPGQGALTQELAARCGRLIAIEIDRELYRRLSVEFQDAGHVNLINDDFLRFPLPTEPYKVFANIPYNQTAKIVRKLVGSVVPPQQAYLILQQEAAEKFAGAPYVAESLFSLLLKPWWHVEILRRLRQTDFTPPPKVHSVLIWMAKRTAPLIDPSEYPLYNDFLTATFAQGGQTIRHILRPVFTERQIVRFARDLRFDSRASPSTLSFDQWLVLFRYTSLDENLALRRKYIGLGKDYAFPKN